MATPPTRVLGVTPAVGWTSNTTPKTSPTFDVQAGDLIVLQAFSEDAQNVLGTPTWTGTGTITLRQSIVISGYCTAYLYTIDVTATQTGRTITMARTAGLSSAQWSFIASVWRNHGGLGVTGKANASGAPSLNLATSANSAVIVGNSDWTASSGTRTWRTVNGAAMTETSFGGTAGVSYMCYTGYAPDSGPAGTVTVGMTAPTGQKYSIMGAEVLGTTGGPEVHTTAATATAKASASAATSSARPKASTATAKAAAPGTTAKRATTASTASAVTSATGTTSTARPVARAAAITVSASGVTATARAAAATAPARATAARATTTQRSASRNAAALASAAALVGTLRSTARTATATASASGVSGGDETHTTAGTATATAQAAAASSGTHSSAATAYTEAQAVATTGTLRATSGAALAKASASGVTTISTEDVRSTTGTASAKASAGASTATLRRAAGGASVVVHVSSTTTALHTTMGAATCTLGGQGATATYRATMGQAIAKALATALSSNPSAWEDIDLSLGPVHGHALRIDNPYGYALSNLVPIGNALSLTEGPSNEDRP